MSLGGVKNPRKAAPQPEPEKRKSESNETPQPPKRAPRVRGKDAAGVGNSEVEREVDRLV